jgi:osmoprotectant transport system permease protein
MTHVPLPLLLLVATALVATDAGAQRVTVGSKAFTESVILGEIVTRLAQDAGAQAEHQREFGGTRVLWNAVLRGDLDIYPEYTGTIEQEILAGKSFTPGEEGLRAAVEAEGLRMGRPLGFNNTYAIGMRQEIAGRLSIGSISDLRSHADLVLGFSNEFMDRGDGWPSLRDAYGLPQSDVRGLQHDLAYRALESEDIHAMDLYSTDAEIEYYGLRVLDDDLAHFPTYNAVFIYRADLETRAPGVVAALTRLQGAIDGSTMSGLNKRAKIDRVSEDRVAADFLETTLRVSTVVEEVTILGRLLQRTREHLTLVILSLVAAILVAVPLGILSARYERLGQVVLGAAGVIQTIPALALLVFMIPFVGTQEPPAVCALFLYSLLPIVRNTYTGLTDIPGNMRESAEALGLRPGVRLRLIELPLASRSILAGIKTSAVINVGFATLGAFIGAGGYGQPILTGLRLDDMGLILQGAVPAAVLALVVQGLFELSERVLVPKGLRLDPVD